MQIIQWPNQHASEQKAQIGRSTATDVLLDYNDHTAEEQAENVLPVHPMGHPSGARIITIKISGEQSRP